MTENTVKTLPSVSIKKTERGHDVTHLGAFGKSSEVTLEIKTSSCVDYIDILIVGEDGRQMLFPLVALKEDAEEKTYSFRFGIKKLLGGRDSELLKWCIKLSVGEDIYYTSSINNVDFTLSDKRGADFKMLCHEADFKTPERFFGGVMYQIFPDRFAKGSKDIPVKPNAVKNDDWYEGIPQYAEAPGGFVANNMFFGGDLYGAADRLPYLGELGVTCVYLNPIFEAYSNHKYDTADYLKVDSMFGGDEALKEFIEKAHKLGIAVVLDGVFNHTGDDSVYFDRYGHYATDGAYESEESKYHSWYFFNEFPDEYESWWGIDILPKLNQKNQKCRRFFTGKDGVCEKYLKMGIDGWRLDVADELPDVFLDEFRASAKGINKDAIVIGEVWENAADKVAYGKLRRYFGGRQLDSVMNYPFKNAVLAFLTNGDERALYNTLTELYASYPRFVSDNLMNILGTHDTERILTLLSGEELFGMSNKDLSAHKMPPEKRERAKRLLKVASVLQYTSYGFPSVYYGDEAGMEGGHDPFCRRPFPWGREDRDLTEHYKKLGRMRKECKSFCGGDFKILETRPGFISYERKKDGERLIVFANASGSFTEVCFEGEGKELLSSSEEKVFGKLIIAPESASVVLIKDN